MRQKRTRYIDRTARRRKRQVLMYIPLTLALLGLCYLFVWQRVYTLSLAHECAQRRQVVHDLMEKCRAMEYDIGKLSSLQRIEQIARRDLQLLPAGDVQLVRFISAQPKNRDSDVGSRVASGKSRQPQLPNGARKVRE